MIYYINYINVINYINYINYSTNYIPNQMLTHHIGI
jgi:hypothetical protein